MICLDVPGSFKPRTQTDETFKRKLALACPKRLISISNNQKIQKKCEATNTFDVIKLLSFIVKKKHEKNDMLFSPKNPKELLENPVETRENEKCLHLVFALTGLKPGSPAIITTMISQRNRIIGRFRSLVDTKYS